MMSMSSINDPSPSQLISNQIAEITDWRGSVYSQLRKLILDSVPGIVEEWKWGTGVWSQNGMVCSVGIFKDHVKLNFFQGASLADPKNLFNAGLEAKKTRGIDFSADDSIEVEDLKPLIQSAAALNNKNAKK